MVIALSGLEVMAAVAFGLGAAMGLALLIAGANALHRRGHGGLARGVAGFVVLPLFLLCTSVLGLPAPPATVLAVWLGAGLLLGLGLAVGGVVQLVRRRRWWPLAAIAAYVAYLALPGR